MSDDWLVRIMPELFSAFLLCPTKCWLKSVGEHGTGNAYAEWVQAQNESYRVAGIDRLRLARPPGELMPAPPTDGLKNGTWRVAFDVLARTENLESRLNALERVPSEGRGKPSQFIPIHFISRNKLTTNDKLRVAFEALLLSEIVGREVGVGRIIHGDDHTTLKVKVSVLAGQVRKANDKITALISIKTPPDLVLNRHCPECEFRERCRKVAIEKEELSLLAGMKSDERRQFNQKGIFTVSQLSYTFRPRRRPKHLRCTAADCSVEEEAG